MGIPGPPRKNGAAEGTEDPRLKARKVFFLPRASMTADEILPNLYLGDGKDLTEFQGSVVYVREDIPLRSRPDARWIPFHRDGKADPAKLDEAAVAIEELLDKGDRVFVHCGAGTKRSPLAVAWFLHRFKGMTLDEAYAFIQRKRPIVQNMTAWLR